MKPRICNILGVDVGENFEYDGRNFVLDLVGNILFTNGRFASGCIACNIVNHPERIIRKARVTDEEKDRIKAAILLINAEFIAKDKNGDVYAYNYYPLKGYDYWYSNFSDTEQIKISSKTATFDWLKFSDESPATTILNPQED